MSYLYLGLGMSLRVYVSHQAMANNKKIGYLESDFPILQGSVTIKEYQL